MCVFVYGCAVQHVGSYFPDQGLNPCPLLGSTGPNYWPRAGDTGPLAPGFGTVPALQRMVKAPMGLEARLGQSPQSPYPTHPSCPFLPLDNPSKPLFQGNHIPRLLT